eukprot:359062-Chlamydomonas_euryale.AAC.1
MSALRQHGRHCGLSLDSVVPDVPPNQAAKGTAHAHRPIKQLRAPPTRTAQSSSQGHRPRAPPNQAAKGTAHAHRLSAPPKCAAQAHRPSTPLKRTAQPSSQVHRPSAKSRHGARTQSRACAFMQGRVR